MRGDHLPSHFSPLTSYFLACPSQKRYVLPSRPSGTASCAVFFTLLGIIVSVGFLVVVVAVIQGMNAYVKENVANALIGTNAFQVRRSPIRSASSMTRRDSGVASAR